MIKSISKQLLRKVIVRSLDVQAYLNHLPLESEQRCNKESLGALAPIGVLLYKSLPLVPRFVKTALNGAEKRRRSIEYF